MSSFFIPRHMRLYARFVYYSSKMRYLITSFILLILSSGWYFGIYQRLETAIDHTEREIYSFYTEYTAALQKKHMQAQLENTVASLKQCTKSCKTYANCSDCIRTRMGFVLDTIQKNDLVLNTYAIGKEQDKGWFVRTKAHLDVAGTMQQLEQLLKIIKNSGTMMQCSQLAISRMTNDRFAMSCQINMIALK